MNFLQVALVGPNGNHGIFRGNQNFRCVGPSINAHIEALPWAGHAESRATPGKQAKSRLLSGHPDWQSICCSSMSRYANRLENGESDVGAGNSVIECALMGIQQTHEPKNARRWRSILKLAHKG